jgi:hypothetical protein
MSCFIHEDREDTNLLKAKCSALLSELKHPFEGNIVNLKNERKFKVPDYMVINLGKLLNYMFHRMYLETITGRKFQDTSMQDSDDYVYVSKKSYSSPNKHFTKDEKRNIGPNEKPIPGMAKWSLQELVSAKYWAELSNYARDKEISQGFCHYGLLHCDMCFNDEFVKILVKMFNMDIDEDQEWMFRNELYKNIAHDGCSSGVRST